MSRRTRQPLQSGLLAFALIALAFSSSARAQSDDLPDTDFATDDTSAAYIIADSLFVTISESGQAKMRFRKIIRVNSSEGVRFGSFTMSENEFRKIKDVTGYRYDNSGKVIDSLVGKKELFKFCGFGPDFALYVEDCTYSSTFRTARVPYTVDWQYTIEQKTIGVWRGWIPDPNLFKRSGYCQIESHPDNRINFSASGGIVPLDSALETGANIQRWTFSNLPACQPEPHEPWPGRSIARLVAVPQTFRFAGKSFSADSWREIAKGNYEMYLAAFKSSAAQDDFFKQHQKSSSESVFSSMHKSLASRLRYVAIYLDMGGWIPHSAKETFQNGYGDCKDLATLYAVMFAKAGAATRTALIATRNSEFINPEMPAFNMFDHVIMFYVEGPDTTWVDPTCFDCALGDLPYSDEGLSALAVDNINGNLLTTPASGCDDNIVCRSIDITLAPDLTAKLNLSAQLLGNPSHGVNTLITGGDRGLVTKALANHLGIAGVPAFDHKDIHISGKDLSRLGLEISWSNSRLLKAAGETQILDLSGFRVMTDAEATDLSKRKRTLEIGYPRTIVDTARVTLPPGYQFKSIPAGVNYTSKFGDFIMNASVSSDTATFVRTISRKLNYIEPSDFEAFAAHRKEISLHSRAVTTITKKK